MLLKPLTQTYFSDLLAQNAVLSQAGSSNQDEVFSSVFWSTCNRGLKYLYENKIFSKPMLLCY